MWTTADSTRLTIEGFGLTPYSARGLKQSFTLIEGAKQQRRNLDGVLRDLSRAEFRKYSTVIEGKDLDPPEFGENWPGMIVTVGWALEFAVRVSGGEPMSPLSLPFDTSPPSMAVPGSIRYANGFLFYRPLRVMMIREFTGDFEEWPADYSWSLTLEDVGEEP